MSFCDLLNDVFEVVAIAVNDGVIKIFGVIILELIHLVVLTIAVLLAPTARNSTITSLSFSFGRFDFWRRRRLHVRS